MNTRRAASLLPRSFRRPLGWLLLASFASSASIRAEDVTADQFLRDYAETRGFMLGRPANATPTPDGRAVLFLRAKGPREPSQELYEYNAATKETRRLLSPADALKGAAEHLSPEEKARRERQRISVGGFTAFGISRDSALVLLSLSGKIYVLRRADGQVTELASREGTIVDPKFSPDGRSVAYVRNQDVCVYDLAAGKERSLTTGGTEVLSHGLAEFVAQEEMGRFSGYWWSPDSKQIAYQENDASKVENWYVADPAQPGNPPDRFFYPRPGKENVGVRLGIISVEDENPATTWVDWDREHSPYLGKVTWSERGPLTLTVLSRDQTGLALVKVDPATGATDVLLTEEDPAWVNLDPSVPRWLSPEKGFLWSSERDGFAQLERHDAKGKLEKVLTRREQGFLSLAGVAGGGACFQANGGDPRRSYLDVVSLNDSPAVRLPDTKTQDLRAGRNTAAFGESETTFVLQTQNAGQMPRSMVCQVGRDEFVGELPSIALEPGIRPRIDFFLLEENAGAGAQQKNSFRTAVITPRDFDADAGKKYPVIVDVYGGPGHQEVIEAMRPYLLDQWLANQGFVVVAFDGRGTPGRGRDWERAVAGKFGSVPLDDQVEALKIVGEKSPFMDLNRAGITGWSFGGYMSAMAVLRRPDVFKAAVAGAPVADWFDYDTCYTERYLGVPGAGRWPDAYKEGSLLTYAAGLQRPLLLIHGTADDNVYFRHSLRLAQELFRAGKPFDFLPLSGFTHMVPDPVVRARLQERVAGYFKEHL